MALPACSSGSLEQRIPTGQVELYVDDLRTLANRETLPLKFSSTTNVKEELRLKAAIWTLGAERCRRPLITRHKIVKVAWDYYDQQGFVEIETPVLIKSHPEGARDYLGALRAQGTFCPAPSLPRPSSCSCSPAMTGISRLLELPGRGSGPTASRNSPRLDMELSFRMRTTS